MAKVHYQSLSRGFHSRESFSGIDPPRLRTRGSKVSEDAGLLQAYATQQRHNLPRNYRTLRIAAYAGWGLAALLLASHLISYFSPFDAVPRVDFGMSGLAPGVEQQVLERQGASGGGIHSRVTIVSGFYKVESGKKHSVSGALHSFCPNEGGGKLISHLPQTTTSGSPPSSAPSTFPLSSTALRACAPSSVNFGGKRLFSCPPFLPLSEPKSLCP